MTIDVTKIVTTPKPVLKWKASAVAESGQKYTAKPNAKDVVITGIYATYVETTDLDIVIELLVAAKDALAEREGLSA